MLEMDLRTVAEKSFEMKWIKMENVEENDEKKIK